MAKTAQTAQQSNYSSQLQSAKVVNGLLIVSQTITNELDGTEFPSIRSFKILEGFNGEVFAAQLEANKDNGKVVNSMLNKYSYSEGQSYCLAEVFASKAEEERAAEKRKK